MQDDPFAVLGLARGASEARVREAFWAKARAMHPDRHPFDPHATERFRRVVLAYEDARCLARGEPPPRRGRGRGSPRRSRPVPRDRWQCDGCGDGFAYPERCPRCDRPLRDARANRTPSPAGPAPEAAAARQDGRWERLRAICAERVAPQPWWLGASCLLFAAGVLALGIRPAGLGILLGAFGAFVTTLDLHERLRRPAWAGG